MKISVQIQYFARFKEESGCSEEIYETSATTPIELYQELKLRYGFTIPAENLRVAINDEFEPWETPLKSSDQIAFIPPVAGG